jgi:Flp pilus assembly protein TadD
MDDARASVAAMMRRAWAAAVNADPAADVPAGPDPVEVAPPAGWDREDGTGLAPAVAALIRRGHPEAAARRLDEARSRGVPAPWAARDRVAVALLHLGRPAEARAIWLDATDPPSPGLKAARLATAALAALDFDAARRDYRTALEIQPDLGEAWFGLAWLHAQAGRRNEARRARQNSVACRLTPAQKSFLRDLERVIDE